MPQLIDGKQHPNPGISKETCDKMHRVSDGEVSPCKRKHREDVANITFDAYQEWMNNIHKPGTPDHTHLRFGQSSFHLLLLHLSMSVALFWDHYFHSFYT